MTYTIGVVMLKPYQLLDAAGAMEVFGMADKQYYQWGNMPTPPKAIDMKILWISDTLEPVELSTYAKLVPTTTFETCPPLDLLFVPGPSSEYVPPPDLAQFLIKRSAETPVVMTTCTGSFVLAGLGILDGKRATVNKETIGLMEERYPKVNWVRDERWVVDGKFWTAGGAAVGIDMAYAFLKGDKFNLDSIPEEALAIIEYTARPQSYA